MIDTLNFQLDNTNFDHKHIQEVFDKKMEFKAATRFKNGSSTTVHYKNYRFTLSEKYLKGVGSLTKLYYGNNIKNLNFNQVQNALNEFETLFQIPFDGAKINRLDFAANIRMNKPINMYLDLLTTPDKYKLRLYEDETKSFEGSKNQLCFYDKIAEVKKSDRVSYSAFHNENILKYEIRFTKNIAKNLKLNDLTIKNLYDPTVYENLLNKWQQGYYQIPKLTKMLPSQISYQTLGLFKNSLMLEGINALGGKESLNMAINQAGIKKNVKYLIKNFITEIDEIAPLSPILQYELDEKINLIYNNELLLLN